MLSSRPLTAFVLGLAVLAGGCDRQSRDKAQPQASRAAEPAEAAAIDRSHKGSELPDLTFRDPAGRELRLASLKGAPVLVNLWATWCAPCIAELPALDALSGRAAGKLRVVTISQDLGQPDKVGAFLRQRGAARLEPWLDPQNELAAHYAVQTLPTTVYYGTDGREVWRLTGGHDWGSTETAALLAEAR